MRLLYVALYPSDGMFPFACSIINSMAKNNEVYVLSVSDEKSSFKNEISEQVTLIDLEYPDSLIKKIGHHFVAILYYRLIDRIIQDYQIELAHFLTGEYGLAFFTKWIQKKVCLVYTVHDLLKHPDSHEGIKTRLYNWYFHNMVIRNTKLISNLCTCSKEQEKKLQFLYPKKNISFHHFPSLVTTAIKNGMDNCIELEGEKGYILFWGNFTEYKGVDLLYNAYLDSKYAGKKKLVIAGKGKWFFSRREDEQGIIRINRFVKDSEVASLFKNADFVVYPYTSVTMSGVMTIAHYFQKRVIVSDLPFFVDNMCESDISFQCGDKDQLTKAIEMLASQESIYVNTLSTNIDVAPELIDFYSDILRRNHSL